MEFKFSQELRDCILDGLKNIIGEKALKVVLFNIELGRYIEDPKELHKYLYAIFNKGAFVLEEVIVRKLFQRLNLPYEEGGNFDFAGYVNQARELFIARQREISVV